MESIRSVVLTFVTIVQGQGMYGQVWGVQKPSQIGNVGATGPSLVWYTDYQQLIAQLLFLQGHTFFMKTIIKLETISCDVVSSSDQDSPYKEYVGLWGLYISGS